MSRWLGAAAVAVGGIVAYEFAPFWMIPLSVGGGLVLTALVLPVKRPDTLMKEGEMDIEQMLNEPLVPRDWNEGRISLDIKELMKQSAMKALQTYIESITERFVIGESQQTILRRTEFLKRQSEMISAMIENYKLRREARRSQRKEDLVDKRTGLDEKKVDHESDLSDFEHELKVEQLKTKIARERQERKNLGKRVTEQPKPSAPSPVSAAEMKQKQRQELKERMREIREEIRLTETNPNLSDEEKHPFINMLHEQMSEIQEQYAKLL